MFPFLRLCVLLCVAINLANAKCGKCKINAFSNKFGGVYNSKRNDVHLQLDKGHSSTWYGRRGCRLLGSRLWKISTRKLRAVTATHPELVGKTVHIRGGNRTHVMKIDSGRRYTKVNKGPKHISRVMCEIGGIKKKFRNYRPCRKRTIHRRAKKLRHGRGFCIHKDNFTNPYFQTTELRLSAAEASTNHTDHPVENLFNRTHGEFRPKDGQNNSHVFILLPTKSSLKKIRIVSLTNMNYPHRFYAGGIYEDKNIPGGYPLIAQKSNDKNDDLKIFEFELNHHTCTDYLLIYFPNHAAKVIRLSTISIFIVENEERRQNREKDEDYDNKHPKGGFTR